MISSNGFDDFVEVAVRRLLPRHDGPSSPAAKRLLPRSRSPVPQLQIPLVARPRNQLYLDHEVAGIWRPLAVSGRTKHPRKVALEGDLQALAIRLKQDHDTAGRCLVASYDPRGQLLSSIVQDPAANRRVVSVRLDGVPYRFEFTLPEDATLSPPEIERLHMETSVAMMQASGNQQLQILDSGSGQQYRIEVPHVSADSSQAVWDLAEAQVVIDADDYHIVAFAVKGTFLKQAYSLSYRLINRVVATGAAVEPGAFDVPQDPGAITIKGEGTAIPGRDVLVVALDELARLKQAARRASRRFRSKG